MNNLLQYAVDAHGGLKRWQEISQLTGQVSIGGGLWTAKGKGGVLDNVQVTVSTIAQYVEYTPFGSPDRYSVYEPDQTKVVTKEEEILESRSDPRASFAAHTRETQWDNLDLIYFSGYAMWTYLMTPFLFTLPGFKTEEIEPWKEGAETWRRLRVQFPADVPSHSTEQTFYFGEDGILRRHDYNADVLGGLPSANYASEPKTFSGVVFPTKRRVYARQGDGHPVRERLAVAIDFHEIAVS